VAELHIPAFFAYLSYSIRSVANHNKPQRPLL